MKCNIEYRGKARSGKPKYYCTVHKSFAHDSEGNKLKKCLCNTKDAYDNHLNIKENLIKEIRIIYDNILENTIPKILIDNREFNGVLEYDNSLLSYKDLSGVMLAKLNNVNLEQVKCHRCNRFHSDNGQFSYTPHSMHLCLYCGHLFRVKEKNIGSELEFIYNIPKIKLNNQVVLINDKCSIEYDLFQGILLINNQNANQVLYQNKTVKIVEFLNNILKDEF